MNERTARLILLGDQRCIFEASHPLTDSETAEITAAIRHWLDTGKVLVLKVPVEVVDWRKQAGQL